MPSSAPVWRASSWFRSDLAQRLAPAAGSVPRSLDLADTVAPLAAALGRDSWTTFTGLATLGAVDLTTARALEPHVDALAILGQAGIEADSGPWGVYAANAPGMRLEATGSPGTWRLSGTKPWCSLAERLPHALVTASAADGGRLFAVDLRQPGVRARPAQWHARGLTDVVTVTLDLVDAAAEPVGGPGWYLDRPGFAWGGIEVAAVWFGAAAALAHRLWETARRREPDQIALLAIGTCETVLHGAWLALRDAATRIDAGDAEGPAGSGLALRVRTTVARAAETVLETVGHALGPAPLTNDEEHARRVADLTVYLRQHHAERDVVALGREVTA